MLARLLSWLSGRPRQIDRGIFRFWDGTKHRSVDPFETLRAIESDVELNLELDAALVTQGDSDAIAKTVRCVRRAFQVKEFSQGGLLEAECLELIERFYEFLDALKKNTSLSPILSAPTASASSDQAPTLTN